MTSKSELDDWERLNAPLAAIAMTRAALVGDPGAIDQQLAKHLEAAEAHGADPGQSLAVVIASVIGLAAEILDKATHGDTARAVAFLDQTAAAYPIEHALNPHNTEGMTDDTDH